MNKILSATLCAGTHSFYHSKLIQIKLFILTRCHLSSQNKGKKNAINLCSLTNSRNIITHPHLIQIKHKPSGDLTSVILQPRPEDCRMTRSVKWEQNDWKYHFVGVMDEKTANAFPSSNASGLRKQWKRIYGADRWKRSKAQNYLEITGKLLSENIVWQKKPQMVGKGKTEFVFEKFH